MAITAKRKRGYDSYVNGQFGKLRVLRNLGSRKVGKSTKIFFLCRCDKRDPEPDLEMVKLAQLRDKVSEFLSVFKEEDLELLFGDHARVTVTPDGVTVEFYEHE